MARSDHLISVSDLAEAMGRGDLRVVDASWHLPTAGRDAAAEFRAKHIPGAVFFDIDAISDTAVDLPHMLPSASDFGQLVGALGIADGDDIVVYDSVGLFSAARVWFSLRAMGASRVRVLDGGLPAWLAAGNPTEAGDARHSAQTFDARLDGGAIASSDDVQAALSDRGQILDARGAARFAGSAPEPRPGLASGHMPGAKNLPFDRITDEAGFVLPDVDLRQALEAAGVDLDRPVITTCGSGVTAAVLSLALAILGHESRLYDGSWAEWGALPNAPIATA